MFFEYINKFVSLGWTSGRESLDEFSKTRKFLKLEKVVYSKFFETQTCLEETFCEKRSEQHLGTFIEKI